VNLWLALPALVPLAGAVLLSSWPLRNARSLNRRAAYTWTLVFTAVAVFLTRGREAVVTAPATSPGFLAHAGGPVWSPLSYWGASMLLLVLIVGQLVDMQRPLSLDHCAHYLVALSATMGTLSTSTLIGLVLSWAVPHYLVTTMRTAQSDVTVRHSQWDTWAGFGSVALLVVGAVATTAAQRGSLYLVQVGPGLAFGALAGAAALRLLVWPLAGGSGRWWQLHANYLTSGFFLWLRLGIALDANTQLLSRPALALVLVLMLGLIAGPRQGKSRVVPYGFGYWLAIGLLAPALDPARGFSISLLVATQLLLSLLILPDSPATWRDEQPRHWAAWVAWGSLAGLLFTCGFAIHWAFAQICYRTGGLGLVGLASLAFLVNALRLGRYLIHPPAMPATQRDETTPPRGTLKLLPVAALLVLLGLWPGVLEHVWPDVRIGLGALSFRSLWGSSAGERAALFVATVLVPASSILLTRRLPELMPELQNRLHWLNARIQDDWPYLLAQRLLGWITGVVRAVLVTIEQVLPVAWSLLWGLALAYYLLQR
jgi:hypothetical protein